ncbi:MAG: hypothetical protein KA085_01150 [Phenylobacterium sp.]|uniref:hypothetical protein n=1 Tax=Phenylobacterium sp. TaxID=1871053 RepID=UPI001B719C04|nr:hypothetical protein [Phenylobacterium sp.]MBP7651037.1 hypothetical protein [Phenylobacterium sp.]MBP7814701.1 hypothetical protein [Phenylobacterium sp.]MBP9232191.1 hypothetical protein [Phenylobacterium sp.]
MGGRLRFQRRGRTLWARITRVNGAAFGFSAPASEWLSLKESSPMTFTKKLRDPIMRGDITCSVRIWQSPRVKVGGRYRLGEGAVVVTSLRQIELTDITPQLARDSGFAGVVDLLKTARHGAGDKVYLVGFEYRPDTRF